MLTPICANHTVLVHKPKRPKITPCTLYLSLGIRGKEKLLLLAMFAIVSRRSAPDNCETKWFRVFLVQFSMVMGWQVVDLAGYTNILLPTSENSFADV